MSEVRAYSPLPNKEPPEVVYYPPPPPPPPPSQPRRTHSYATTWARFATLFLTLALVVALVEKITHHVPTPGGHSLFTSSPKHHHHHPSNSNPNPDNSGSGSGKDGRAKEPGFLKAYYDALNADIHTSPSDLLKALLEKTTGTSSSSHPNNKNNNGANNNDANPSDKPHSKGHHHIHRPRIHFGVTHPDEASNSLAVEAQRAYDVLSDEYKRCLAHREAGVPDWYGYVPRYCTGEWLEHGVEGARKWVRGWDVGSEKRGGEGEEGGKAEDSEKQAVGGEIVKKGLKRFLGERVVLGWPWVRFGDVEGEGEGGGGEDKKKTQA